MKEFMYKIKDEVGIHARPAGMLVKEAEKYKSEIMLKNTANEKVAAAKKLFAVMGLAVKCGDEVCVSADGEDEDAALSGICTFVFLWYKNTLNIMHTATIAPTEISVYKDDVKTERLREAGANTDLAGIHIFHNKNE